LGASLLLCTALGGRSPPCGGKAGKQQPHFPAEIRKLCIAFVLESQYLCPLWLASELNSHRRKRVVCLSRGLPTRHRRCSGGSGPGPGVVLW